ncbi:MAG: hypothetical protein WBL21_11335 [Salinimicrobium sp.]
MKAQTAFTLLLFSSVLFTSCRDTEKDVKEDKVVHEVVVKKEPVEVKVEKQEGVLERTAKKVDQKVNKKIDEEIDKIGEDN